MLESQNLDVMILLMHRWVHKLIIFTVHRWVHRVPVFGRALIIFKESDYMEKVACFLDAGYLNKVFTTKIDYLKLIAEMVGQDNLLRTYYYDCKVFMSNPPTDDERDRKARQDSFFSRLQTFPKFECKFGRLERHYKSNGDFTFVQKRVDVMLAIDLVTLSTKKLITKANLITGDSDLIPAIQIAKNEGIVVELFYVPQSTHTELLQTVDIATEINDDWLNKIKR